MQYIEYAIDSDMTSDEIKVGLKKLCEKIGEQSMVQTCEQFVDKYRKDANRISTGGPFYKSDNARAIRAKCSYNRTD